MIQWHWVQVCFSEFIGTPMGDSCWTSNPIGIAIVHSFGSLWCLRIGFRVSQFLMLGHFTMLLEHVIQTLVGSVAVFSLFDYHFHGGLLPSIRSIKASAAGVRGARAETCSTSSEDRSVGMGKFWCARSTLP